MVCREAKGVFYFFCVLNAFLYPILHRRCLGICGNSWQNSAILPDGLLSSPRQFFFVRVDLGNCQPLQSFPSFYVTCSLHSMSLNIMCNGSLAWTREGIWRYEIILVSGDMRSSWSINGFARDSLANVKICECNH